jgi:hypothetical protein
MAQFIVRDDVVNKISSAMDLIGASKSNTGAKLHRFTMFGLLNSVNTSTDVDWRLCAI